MTTTAPIQVTAGPGTAPLTMVLETPARHRVNVPATEVPAWAQLGCAVAVVALAWFAILLAPTWPWAALPIGILAATLFVGTFLPDLLVAHWTRAGQDTEDAA